MTENEIAEPVLAPIDAVFAIHTAKHEADDKDHAEPRARQKTIGTFLATHEEHMPESWQDDAPLAQPLYLEVWLDGRGEARREATVDLVRRWLEKRIADTASAN